VLIDQLCILREIFIRGKVYAELTAVYQLQELEILKKNYILIDNNVLPAAVPEEDESVDCESNQYLRLVSEPS
jgi:hypothetical protein